jgi:aminoglycoside phosphotransferase (APT) family kinase protein
MITKKNGDPIEPYLADKLGVEDLSVTSFWKNLEGWSMETFSLGLSYKKDGKKVEQDIIIRKTPDAGLMDDNYDVSIEFRVLAGYNKTDVAVPEVFWMEEDTEVLGQPFYVMAKVEGDIPFPPAMAFDPKYRLFPDDDERKSLSDDFVKNLAGIHNADWKGLGLDFLGVPPEGDTGSALHQVEFWEDRITRSGLRHKPVVAYATAWLKDNLVPNDKICVVHGDYRAGNFITKDKRIVAVLDWELVSLGDPLFDIAYSLCSWRSAPPDKWISHLMTKQEFFDSYEKASGIKVDMDKLGFYILLHFYKAFGIASTAAGAFKNHDKLNLKIGAFAMMQYGALAGLMKEIKKRPI